MPSSLVVSGFGINCEKEMALAYKIAGAQTDIVHFNHILSGKTSIHNYDILNFPGGFSFGDDLGAAKALANKIQHSIIDNTRFLDTLHDFIQNGNFILGICNGFQLLAKLGVFHDGIQKSSLAPNISKKFENRWVNHKITNNSPFTKGIESIFLPVRHGEGKFIASDETIQKLFSQNQIALQYADHTAQPTQQYPSNPNGSINAIAGVTNPEGNVFGMMAHPEAYLYWTHHPSWTRLRSRLLRERKPLPKYGSGLKIFTNIVNEVKR